MYNNNQGPRYHNNNRGAGHPDKPKQDLAPAVKIGDFYEDGKIKGELFGKTAEQIA